MAIGYNPSVVTNGLTFCYDETNTKSGTTKELVTNATSVGVFTSEIRFAANSLTDTMWSVANNKDSLATGSGFSINLWNKRTSTTTGTWDEICLLEFDVRCMWFGYVTNQTAQFHCSFPYYNASNVFTYWNIDPTFANASITHAIGTWYNTCITYNNASRLLSVYINSTFALSGTRPGTGDLIKPYTGTNPPIRIWGTQGLSSKNHLTNYVSLYNKTLTANEVQNNFNALRGRFGV
jgi:hypothetical protein